MKFPNPINLSALLEIIDCKAETIGNQNISISGINEIHSVEAGDICFVDHPKYYQKVIQSPATLILINQKADIPEGKTLVVLDDPFQAYLKVVKHFRVLTSQNELIAADAITGEGTVIQPGTFIGKNVTIGKNCIIHANVSIYDHTVIGNDCVIHSGAVIGADAFYFQKRADGWHKMISCGSVHIGNRVEIGALTSIDKGVSGDTVIGDGCKFDNHIQVGHDTKIGKNCLIGAHSAIAGCTVVEDDCLIWAKVVVNKDLVLKKGTTVLATAAVDKTMGGENQVLIGQPAGDARRKWREMAAARMLPELMQEFEALKKKVEAIS